MLKFYRNEVWDLIDNFFIAFNISFIPRDHNQTIDSLDLAATYFKIPKVSHLKYPIEVRYRPSVPNNAKHWKVFHDDLEIKQFLELTGEFSTSAIDNDEVIETDQILPFLENIIANHDIIKLK